MAYYHAQQPEFNAAVCSLKTLNGAHLPVARVEFEGDDLKVTTIGGLDFRLSQEILHTADFSQGKISYLSDLQPRKQVWTPHIALPSDADHIQDYGQPRKDQSFAGSALTLEWSAVTGAPENKSSVSEEIHTYNKGLAIRSRTELVYRLPPKMQRFFAIAGINPSTSKQGNVMLEIYANKQLVWQGEIDGNSEPSEIEVAIDGARELRILVDYGSNLDYGDQLHLVEAKVTK